MSGDLQGRRVLVLEDDYLLATDLERWLKCAGAVVVGPFAGTEEALQALAENPPHAALLDINLGDAPSFEMAGALDQASIPFVFVTGYEGLPERWRHIPHVVKPFEERALLDALRRLPSP